jgi:hypothetical protein
MLGTLRKIIPPSQINLASGILLMVIILRGYRHQLRDIPNKILTIDDNEESLRRLVAGGESKAVEFKSTVRKNLKSGQNGKEIELADE